MNCESCRTKNCFIVKYVNPKLLAGISQSNKAVSYKQGQTIFREGNRAKGLYFVKKGKVKVFFTQNGQNHIIQLLEKGDVLGYRGFGGKDLYPISASTIEDSVICFLPKAKLFKQLRYNPILAFHLTLLFESELVKFEERWPYHSN